MSATHYQSPSGGAWCEAIGVETTCDPDEVGCAQCLIKCAAGHEHSASVMRLVLQTARNKAWARLVRATEVRWREDIRGAAQVDYARESEASKQALRDLGVPVDALLEES